MGTQSLINDPKDINVQTPIDYYTIISQSTHETQGPIFSKTDGFILKKNVMAA